MFHIYGTDDCPYCLNAKAFLMQKGKPFIFYDLTYSGKEHIQITKDNFLVKTIPIIIFENETNDIFIGGFEELKKFFLWNPFA